MKFTPAAGLIPLLAAAAATAATTAPSTMNGGGAASQYFNYAAPDVNGNHVAEMPLFNSLQSVAQFGTYWSTTSGAAQTGLLNDDLSCISNKAQNINGGNCNGTTIGGSQTVHYAVSESTLTSTQIANWSTSSTGQAVAGNLIQIPMLGTGLAVVVNNPSVTSNGQVELSDNDLCGIFSGRITDFSQLKSGTTNVPAGPLQVLYRSDSAGTTFLLTNHLSAVCTASNSAVTFTPTSSWATVFPHGVPSNFVGISGLSTLANTLAGLNATQYPAAVSFISPDWTSIDSATSTAKLQNGQPSPLLVAALQNVKTFYLPTRTNILSGLGHAAIGQNLTPPTTAAAGALPGSWVPVIQTTSTGYPMVGYSTFDLPQCYSDPKVQKEMVYFLTNHYHSSQFFTIENNNGLVSPTNSGAATFVKSVSANILRNQSGWNTDIGNATACKGLTGR